MTRTVHIEAVGAQNAVGLTAESTAAAVRAGVSRVREHPFMVDAPGDPLRCGYDSGIDAALFGADRMLALAQHALAEAAAKLTSQRPCPAPVRALLAFPEPRPGFALMRTASAFQDGTDYRTPVPQCGEVGAATAALSCVLATQAWHRGYANGELALACGSSWTGLRAPAVLERSAS